jgi:hypothetical protein
MGERDFGGGFDREDLLGRLGRCGLRQEKRERQHRGDPAPGSGQPPREPERRKDVDQEKPQRRGQKRALEQRLLLDSEAFDRDARRPDDGREHRVATGYVERDAPVLARIEAGRRRRAGHGLGERLARHAGKDARLAHAAEGVEHFVGQPDRAGEVLGRLSLGPRGHGEPVEHAHEEPRQRERRPFSVRRDVEEDDLPLLLRACG